MKETERIQEWNEKLIKLGEQLEKGGSTARDSLRSRLAGICGGAKEQQVFLPYQQLCESLELDGYEQLLLCLLWHRKREENRGLPYGQMRNLLRPYEELWGKDSLSPCFWLVRDEVELSPVAQGFLEMKEPLLPEGLELELPHQQKCYGLEEFLEVGSRMARNRRMPEEGPCCLVLSGEPGSGRHFAAGQLAASLDMALLTISAGAAVGNDRQIGELLLCVQLYQALICVEADCALLPALTLRLAGYVPFLLMIREPEISLDMDLGYDLCLWQMELPGMGLKEKILRDILEDGERTLPPGLTVQTLAARRMPVGKYIRYLRNIRLSLRLGTFRPEGDVYQPESPYLKLIPANRTMEELKLPRAQTEQLRKICRIIGASGQVLEQWGYRKKYSYGNGISVLFYGAPGTGKTMAAQVLANTLGAPLLRVDLSQLISKYIGETQKNIGRVFDEAQRCDCVLLFDEADAIFARRSDVSDAQDRYSNAETAYLLQRIEQYSGVSVLATNLLQNFDEAFRRRITYMLHFPMPDEELRRQLWQSVLPEEAEVSPDMDYETLARAFELSGAAIKNASFHGACCAWAEGCGIQMRHLLDGIQNEYTKTGKTFSEEQRQLLETWKQ